MAVPVRPGALLPRCLSSRRLIGAALLPWLGLGAVATSAAWAQPAVAPTIAPAAATAPRPSPASPVASASPEVRIIEDDRVRIEETRVRGQLQRVVVSPKGPAGSALRPYEINVGAGGRDPSQDKSSAGQRVWSVLRF